MGDSCSVDLAEDSHGYIIVEVCIPEVQDVDESCVLKSISQGLRVELIDDSVFRLNRVAKQVSLDHRVASWSNSCLVRLVNIGNQVTQVLLLALESVRFHDTACVLTFH